MVGPGCEVPAESSVGGLAGPQSSNLVSFIKVEKQKQTRKNLKGQLVFWNKETTCDYKFAKYLE